LMPSRFELCGLTQCQAMRYGCIPVAHATGGLRDTIVDASDDARARGIATGFLIEHADARALVTGVNRALAVYADRVAWHSLVTHAMQRDAGWMQSAQAYAAVYAAARR